MTSSTFVHRVCTPLSSRLWNGSNGQESKGKHEVCSFLRFILLHGWVIVETRNDNSGWLGKVHCKGHKMPNINNVVEFNDKKFRKQLLSEIKSFKMLKIWLHHIIRSIGHHKLYLKLLLQPYHVFLFMSRRIQWCIRFGQTPFLMCMFWIEMTILSRRNLQICDWIYD